MQPLRCLVFILASLSVLQVGPLVAQKAPPTFQDDVAPILAANCLACHAEAAQSGLDLRTVESILKGGMSRPAVVPGKSEESLLMAKVVSGQMPPGPSRLAVAQIDIIRDWIDKTLAAKEDLTASAPEAALLGAGHRFAQHADAGGDHRYRPKLL
jgi:hypothetical protein